MAAARWRIPVLLFLLPIAAGMALSSLNHWRWLLANDVEADPAISAAGFNLFKDDSLSDFRRRNFELESALDYMTWRSEQDRIRRQQLSLVQQQINRTPLNGVLWQNLVDLQSYLPDQREQIGWSLERAVSMMGWRARSFASLAHHCIYMSQYLTTSQSRTCTVLLANSIDRYSAGNVKKSLGMTPEQFRQLQLDARDAL